MTSKQILAIAMPENDAEAGTIGSYLAALLHQLWLDGESFDGKRPWGNSGWQYDVYAALIKAGAMPGKLDQDGFVEDCSTETGDDLIAGAIDALVAGGK